MCNSINMKQLEEHIETELIAYDGSHQ